MASGIIAQAKGPMFGERVYFCYDGKRRWVRTAKEISTLGFRWPDDLVQISEVEMGSLRYAGPLPNPQVTKATAPSSVANMRDFLTKGLSGIGLEVGAGASPFPVPLECETLFADRFSHNELIAARYEGQILADIVPPHFHADLGDLSNVRLQNFNYLLACHVIEHVADPIGAIIAGLSKLHSGGVLILVVPDMTRTFDRNRAITTLAHLIEDYKNPKSDLDYEHYLEFYTKAFPKPPNEVEGFARKAFQNRSDIHYHVWTLDSFHSMLEWIRTELASISKVEVWPTVENDPNGHEFYVRLTK